MNLYTDTAGTVMNEPADANFDRDARVLSRTTAGRRLVQEYQYESGITAKKIAEAKLLASDKIGQATSAEEAVNHILQSADFNPATAAFARRAAVSMLKEDDLTAFELNRHAQSMNESIKAKADQLGIPAPIYKRVGKEIRIINPAEGAAYEEAIKSGETERAAMAESKRKLAEIPKIAEVTAKTQADLAAKMAPQITEQQRKLAEEVAKSTGLKISGATQDQNGSIRFTLETPPKQTPNEALAEAAKGLFINVSRAASHIDADLAARNLAKEYNIEQKDGVSVSTGKEPTQLISKIGIRMADYVASGTSSTDQYYDLVKSVLFDIGEEDGSSIEEILKQLGGDPTTLADSMSKINTAFGEALVDPAYERAGQLNEMAQQSVANKAAFLANQGSGSKYIQQRLTQLQMSEIAGNPAGKGFLEMLKGMDSPEGLARKLFEIESVQLSGMPNSMERLSAEAYLAQLQQIGLGDINPLNRPLYDALSLAVPKFSEAAAKEVEVGMSRAGPDLRTRSEVANGNLKYRPSNDVYIPKENSQLLMVKEPLLADIIPLLPRDGNKIIGKTFAIPNGADQVAQNYFDAIVTSFIEKSATGNIETIANPENVMALNPDGTVIIRDGIEQRAAPWTSRTVKAVRELMDLSTRYNSDDKLSVDARVAELQASKNPAARYILENKKALELFKSSDVDKVQVASAWAVSQHYINVSRQVNANLANGYVKLVKFMYDNSIIDKGFLDQFTSMADGGFTPNELREAATRISKSLDAIPFEKRVAIGQLYRENGEFANWLADVTSSGGADASKRVDSVFAEAERQSRDLLDNFGALSIMANQDTYNTVLGLNNVINTNLLVGGGAPSWYKPSIGVVYNNDSWREGIDDVWANELETYAKMNEAMSTYSKTGKYNGPVLFVEQDEYQKNHNMWIKAGKPNYGFADKYKFEQDDPRIKLVSKEVAVNPFLQPVFTLKDTQWTTPEALAEWNAFRKQYGMKEIEAGDRLLLINKDRLERYNRARSLELPPRDPIVISTPQSLGL